jgi:hypothetical protein
VLSQFSNNNNNNNNDNDNKTDIAIRDNRKATCRLIDVAISGTRNVIKGEDEKILKHGELNNRNIYSTWNVNTKVVPVIIGTAGTASKSRRKYLCNIYRDRVTSGGYREEPEWALRTGHCARTAGSADLKLQDIGGGKLHYMFLLWLDSPHGA